MRSLLVSLKAGSSSNLKAASAEGASCLNGWLPWLGGDQKGPSIFFFTMLFGLHIPYPSKKNAVGWGWGVFKEHLSDSMKIH